ncbi:MAG: hypothetical protein HONBIEJF_02414 [Fimbriimonadaceae bacterium]|nr:hypothetical protein [Fimbriimonadaceae bacterium]
MRNPSSNRLEDGLASLRTAQFSADPSHIASAMHLAPTKRRRTLRLGLGLVGAVTVGIVIFAMGNPSRAVAAAALRKLLSQTPAYAVYTSSAVMPDGGLRQLSKCYYSPSATRRDINHPDKGEIVVLTTRTQIRKLHLASGEITVIEADREKKEDFLEIDFTLESLVGTLWKDTAVSLEHDVPFKGRTWDRYTVEQDGGKWHLYASPADGMIHWEEEWHDPDWRGYMGTLQRGTEHRLNEISYPESLPESLFELPEGKASVPNVPRR